MVLVNTDWGKHAGYLLLVLITAVSPKLKAQTQSGYSIADAAPWIIEAPYAVSRNSNITQPQRYLLINRQFRFENAQHERYYRSVAQALTASGVEQISEIRLQFNPGYETLALHNIRVIRGGTTRDITAELTPRFLEQEPEINQLMQTGVVTALFNLPDIRKGDIVDFAYTLTGQNPILGTLPFGGIAVNWGVSVDTLAIRLLSDIPLAIKLKNTDQQVTQNQSSNSYEYLYRDNNTRLIRDEGDYPHGVSPYGWLQYSAYDSWTQVNSWAQDVYARVEVDHEISALAKQLSKDSQNLRDYIRKSIHFVQENIRYLGLEFGENTHLPRPPADVLKTRYGDCKDKALLLTLLLKERGITAYSALVNTESRGAIGDWQPSPGAFDHVITLIEFDGKRFWVDGTRLYQGAELDKLSQTDYGLALLIGHKETGLVDMYHQSPIISEIDLIEAIRLSSFKAPAEYQVTTTFKGLSAEMQRYRFANNSKQKIMDDYLDYYRKLYDDIEFAKDIQYQDNVAKNEVTITELYNVKNIVETNNTSHVVPVNLATYAHYLNKPRLKERDLPYYLGEPSIIKTQFSIEYPVEVDLTFPQKPKIYDSEIYRYEYTDQYRNKIYQVDSKLTIKSDRIPPKQLGTYHEEREKLLDEWYYSITVPRQDLFEGYAKIIQLKNLLREQRDQIRE